MSEEAKQEIVVDEVANLKKALEEEKARAEAYLENWKRAQADYINFKKRTEQEKEEIIKFANFSLILSLLPLLDDLERAFSSLSERLAGLSWIEGIRLIYRKLLATLQVQGVSEIEAEGKDFDPQVHQVVMYAEGEENKVLEVVQKGYKLHGRVLRPALVIVGQGKASKEEKK